MKNALSVLALAGTLALVGASPLPASAQTRADVMNDPRAVTYSWGVEVTSDDGPSTSYTWQELDAAGNVRGQSLGSDRAAAAAEILNDPRAVRYSWGVVIESSDGPQRSYPY